MMNLTRVAKLTRHSNAVSAGQSTVTPTSGIDMKGFDSCTFLVAWGAITSGGVQSIEVHQSSDDGDTDAYSAIAGSKVSVADSESNKLAFVEVVNPQKRYLKCIINRATQNSVVDGIFSLQYNAKDVPVTHDASTVSGGEVHLAPSEGTA